MLPRSLYSPQTSTDHQNLGGCGTSYCSNKMQERAPQSIGCREMDDAPRVIAALGWGRGCGVRQSPLRILAAPRHTPTRKSPPFPEGTHARASVRAHRLCNDWRFSTHPPQPRVEMGRAPGDWRPFSFRRTRRDNAPRRAYAVDDEFAPFPPVVGDTRDQGAPVSDADCE